MEFLHSFPSGLTVEKLLQNRRYRYIFIVRIGIPAFIENTEEKRGRKERYSLTPMGVRALGARMRENCNTPLTLFGYLIFHMSASSFFSSLLRMCQNLSTPSYLLISCFFYLLFNNLSRLRQFARAVINNANLRLDVRIESQFCVS